MAGKHYTNEQKKKAAQMAIKHKANGGNYSDVAEIVGCHMTMVGKWVDAYRLGKLDEPKQPETTTELKALKEIDIRPELAKITKAIKDIGATFQFLNSNMHKVVIRLDSIYSKLTECETISKDLENEFNGD